MELSLWVRLRLHLLDAATVARELVSAVFRYVSALLTVCWDPLDYGGMVIPFEPTPAGWAGVVVLDAGAGSARGLERRAVAWLLRRYDSASAADWAEDLAAAGLGRPPALFELSLYRLGPRGGLRESRTTIRVRLDYAAGTWQFGSDGPAQRFGLGGLGARRVVLAAAAAGVC